ncbi:MAG: hypothetical protein LBS21_01745 [Clostridiales bacterium]|nr:hypothetical protein [Clostridiales bacterium]
MDKTFYNTMLYDFYGELLSEKQKQIYEMYYLFNYSLAEVSERIGISRQGVRESILKSEKTLQNYEQKLSLIADYLAKKQEVQQLSSKIDEIASNCRTRPNCDFGPLLNEIKAYLLNSIE